MESVIQKTLDSTDSRTAPSQETSTRPRGTNDADACNDRYTSYASKSDRDDIRSEMTHIYHLTFYEVTISKCKEGTIGNGQTWTWGEIPLETGGTNDRMRLERPCIPVKGGQLDNRGESYGKIIDGVFFPLSVKGRGMIE